tara:strand:+ start:950 stop:1345 length:396 start_codon:yes stop_codon:yes gene_type:complete
MIDSLIKLKQIIWENNTMNKQQVNYNGNATRNGLKLKKNEEVIILHDRGNNEYLIFDRITDRCFHETLKCTLDKYQFAKKEWDILYPKINSGNIDHRSDQPRLKSRNLSVDKNSVLISGDITKIANRDLPK